jgi:ribosome biogenesis GTPase
MIDISFERLRRIGLTPAGASRLAAIDTSHPGARAMRVTETQRDACTLHDGDDEHRARILPRIVNELHSRGDATTIGDWVIAEPDAASDWWVAQRIEPLTQIARRANDGRRQPLASNVDTALLVMGLDADFNPRRMERYIAMVRACDVVPVVVLTKADIAPDARARTADICRRLPATVPVLAVNGLAAQARHELGPWLYPGCTLVMLGASGAGKSTLTNTLVGDAHQATGAVRKGDGRGRHTTTARSLHRLAEGACIIDTPGLRTWRPDADEQSLAATFEDVQSLAMRCQFRDCRHENEPGCAVRAAIAADRLLNYHKLLRDAQRAGQTPLDRIELRRKWKKLGKAGSQRVRDKRGLG